jgi:hypothetical protein
MPNRPRLQTPAPELSASNGIFHPDRLEMRGQQALQLRSCVMALMIRVGVLHGIAVGRRHQKDATVPQHSVHFSDETDVVLHMFENFHGDDAAKRPFSKRGVRHVIVNEAPYIASSLPGLSHNSRVNSQVEFLLNGRFPGQISDVDGCWNSCRVMRLSPANV